MYIDTIYETENAIFKFLLPDVKARLNYYAYEHGMEKAKDLINSLKSSYNTQTVIPEKCHYFYFIIVDLIVEERAQLSVNNAIKHMGHLI